MRTGTQPQRKYSGTQPDTAGTGGCTGGVARERERERVRERERDREGGGGGGEGEEGGGRGG